jgi:hypothetical protein
VTPVVALAAAAEALGDVADDIDLKPGDTLFTWE